MTDKTQKTNDLCAGNGCGRRDGCLRYFIYKVNARLGKVQANVMSACIGEALYIDKYGEWQDD